MAATDLKYSFLVLLGIISGIDSFIEVRGIPEPSLWFWTSTILLNAAIFSWYIRDSNERSFLRNKWLNIGVIALPPVAVPVYIFRREIGASRLRISLSMLGYIVVFFFVAMGTALAGGLLGYL